jgi:hypothetical protein
MEKYFGTDSRESECFAAVRITCSKCREWVAKTAASLCVNCWRKSAFIFGNIGLCVAGAYIYSTTS